MSAVEEGFSTYVSVQRRGLIALPRYLRKRYHLDTPGAQVQIVERADGVIELHPNVAVPATEAWFWDESWQEGERQVDQHVRAGRTTTFGSDSELLAGLSDLDQNT